MVDSCEWVFLDQITSTHSLASSASSQQCPGSRMADNESLTSSNFSSEASDNLSELDLDSLESGQDDTPRTQNLRAHRPSRQTLPVEPTVIPTSFASFRPSRVSFKQLDLACQHVALFLQKCERVYYTFAFSVS